MKFLCIFLFAAFSSLMQTTTANGSVVPNDAAPEDTENDPQDIDDSHIICRCFGRDSTEVKAEIPYVHDDTQCQCYRRRGQEEVPVKTEYMDNKCQCSREEPKIDYCIEERAPRVCSCNRFSRPPYPIEKSISVRPRCRTCSRQDTVECALDDKYVYCRPAPHYPH